MAASYKDYQDLLSKDEPMSIYEKERLKRNIELLEAMDHVEIIRIIRDSMTKRPYTVSSRQTMLDLDDLDSKCLWRISYYVEFCLDNQNREKARDLAHKQHTEKLQKLEDDIKRQSKLKLTPALLNDSNRSTIKIDLESDLPTADLADDEISE